MPELPEVQTLINHLIKNEILNHKVIEVKIIKPKILKNATIEDFESFLINQKITNILRRGKYLIFELTQQKYLTIHLRMEGKIFYESVNDSVGKHVMVVIRFDNQMQMIYDDTRMFGTFHIYPNKLLLFNSKELKNVAIDPLDWQFNSEWLFNKLKNSKKHIKTALLDQKIVSGIGNIYADEILFTARINPLIMANHLKLLDYEKIVKAAKEILKSAIEHKGTTIFTYKFDRDHTGGYQNLLQVHTHKGLPCYACGTKIVKTNVNQRGTYYCPQCQKEQH